MPRFISFFKVFNSIAVTRVILISASMSVMLGGCGSGQATEEEIKTSRGFDYGAMLANYADNIIVPSYQKAHEEVLSLQSLTDNYCAALSVKTSNLDGSNASTANLDAMVLELEMEEQWNVTMATWQTAEMLWLGPLLEGDLALRNRIYGFGTLSRASSCSVDVSAASIDDVDFNITTRANNTRGLGAMEYLIFNKDLNHTCSDLVQKTETWNARSEMERKQARCQLAQAVVGNIADNTSQLVQRWSAQGENYRSLFLNENNASEHLKQLSDALFYLDKEVKDSKLGLPLALAGSCQAQACPEAVESRYAKSSINMVQYNLEAFKALFNGVGVKGSDGLGFDDVIRFENAPEVADLFNQNIDRALQFAKELAASGDTLFSEATRQQTSAEAKAACENASAQTDVSVKSYCTLHGLVKVITDQLRTDFVTIVNVDLPKRTQTDND